MALPSDDGIPVPPSRPGDRANMRTVFCQSLEEASRRPNFIFLTGDLGYKALEPLRRLEGAIHQCRCCRAKHGFSRCRTARRSSPLAL